MSAKSRKSNVHVFRHLKTRCIMNTPLLRHECSARCGCCRFPDRHPRSSGSARSSCSACNGPPALPDFSATPRPESATNTHAACPEPAATRVGATPAAPPHSTRAPSPPLGITVRSAKRRPHARLVRVQRFEVIPPRMAPARDLDQATRRVLEESIVSGIGIHL